jgi:hypothetical protein
VLAFAALSLGQKDGTPQVHLPARPVATVLRGLKDCNYALNPAQFAGVLKHLRDTMSYYSHWLRIVLPPRTRALLIWLFALTLAGR